MVYRNLIFIEFEDSASAWYRKAAESGEPDAMYRVGVECFSTNATPERRAEANSWFRRAKAAGSRIENLDQWIKLTDAPAPAEGKAQ